MLIALVNLNTPRTNRFVTSAFADAEVKSEPAGSVLVPIESDKMARTRLSKSYGNLPMSFEVNRGQFDSRVKFMSRGNGYSIFLTACEARMVLGSAASNSQQTDKATVVKRREDDKSITLRQDVLSIKLAGANPSAYVEGVNQLPGKSNYFIGDDPGKWRANISLYAKVKYTAVYRGIDLIYYGDQKNLEYDFVVAPRANPRAINLVFEGAGGVRINAGGELVLSASGGEIRQHKPVVYQEMNGARKEIAARYVMKGKNQVGFEIAQYDTSKPLVIDPVLVYSTYLGGRNDDSALGVAVDSSGAAYVTGATQSTNFPVMNPIQPASGGLYDLFVTKLAPNGSALVYSTYLGGSNFDSLIESGIAIDTAGNAYVTGFTQSTNFPTTPGAFQPAYGGQGEFSQTIGDAFVAKIAESASFDFCLQDDSSGSRIQFNSMTGEYLMNNCGSFTLGGTGVITKKGCLLTLQDTRPDRRVLVKLDTCAKKGTASIQAFAQGITFTLTDKNTANNTCACH